LSFSIIARQHAMHTERDIVLHMSVCQSVALWYCI